MVAVALPSFALPGAVILRVAAPDPGAGRVVGVKVDRIPAGKPVTEKFTGALKPPLVVTVSVMLWFELGDIETELADAAR